MSNDVRTITVLNDIKMVIPGVPGHKPGHLLNYAVLLIEAL
jgi:hypothetical protein